MRVASPTPTHPSGLRTPPARRPAAAAESTDATSSSSQVPGRFRFRRPTPWELPPSGRRARNRPTTSCRPTRSSSRSGSRRSAERGSARVLDAATIWKMIAMPIGGITHRAALHHRRREAGPLGHLQRAQLLGLRSDELFAPARHSRRSGRDLPSRVTAGGKTRSAHARRPGLPRRAILRRVSDRLCGVQGRRVSGRGHAGGLFAVHSACNAEDSALPATVMQFTVKNTSQARADGRSWRGWLENAVCRHSGEVMYGVRTNRSRPGRRAGRWSSARPRPVRAAQGRAPADRPGRFRGRGLRQVDGRGRGVRHRAGPGHTARPAERSAAFRARAWSTRSSAATTRRAS